MLSVGSLELHWCERHDFQKDFFFASSYSKYFKPVAWPKLKVEIVEKRSLI